ncbi:MAG: thermonuclease family protein [bacterium]
MGNPWIGQTGGMDRFHSHTVQRLVCALLMLLLIASVVPCARGQGGYPDGSYMVEEIVDGDTFIIAGRKRVRLIGIDAPDHGEFCAEQARQRLTSLILGKTVFLERDTTETDEYDRLLRYAFIGDTFVNGVMVSEGYAWAITRQPDDNYASRLEAAEEDARQSGRGCLWGDLFLWDGSRGYLQVGCLITVLR